MAVVKKKKGNHFSKILNAIFMDEMMSGIYFQRTLGKMNGVWMKQARSVKRGLILLPSTFVHILNSPSARVIFF